MRHQYRLTWTFTGRPPLIRLVHFSSDGAAVRAAKAPEFQRGIFRRAGLASRTTSGFEYRDRFPVPAYVNVERAERT